MRDARLQYEPRNQFRPFHHRNQRWAIIVAHRRAGKTVATINDLIWRALRDNAMRSWRPGQGLGLEISQNNTLGRYLDGVVLALAAVRAASVSGKTWPLPPSNSGTE